MVKVAIIAGTGYEDLAEGECLEVETPYGKALLREGELGGRKTFFLQRHGKGHAFPPHRINYRANIWALKEVGVERILAVNSVGAISEWLKPGDLLIPVDFMDFTKSRPLTFYEEWKTVHVDLSQPFCPELLECLREAFREVGIPIKTGVLACTEGPRLETPAEIRALRVLGADVVGMTLVPECVLARELELCYASVSLVTNMAAGIGKPIEAEEVKEVVGSRKELVWKVLEEAVKRIPEERNCPCSRALRGARL